MNDSLTSTAPEAVRTTGSTSNFHTDGASNTFRTLRWALGHPRAIGEGADTFTFGSRFVVSACNLFLQSLDIVLDLKEVTPCRIQFRKGCVSLAGELSDGVLLTGHRLVSSKQFVLHFGQCCSESGINRGGSPQPRTLPAAVSI